MSDDIKWEVQKVVSDMRAKYVYFLLAAVGASIGFAVTQSKDVRFDAWALPLGVAIVLWALSFICGCAYLNNSTRLFMQSFQLMSLGGSSIFDQSNRRADKMRELRDVGLKITSKADVLYGFQFICFVGGAVSFILWHVLAIWLRTAEEHRCILWS